MQEKNTFNDLTTVRLKKRYDIYEPLIKEQIVQHGLPLHLFFVEEMEHHVEGYFKVQKKLYENLTISFAVKSNPCRGAVRTASKLGMGADTASEYELQVALEEGIEAKNITCNGNAKSSFYLHLAVKNSCIIVLDNIDEWKVLEDICADLRKTADVLIRFRGMPLSGLTADDQSTAADWTKFGFHIDESKELLQKAKASKYIHLKGISAHIGTQLCKPIGYIKLFESMFEIAELANNLGLPIEILNIGGGFPVEFIDQNNAQRFQNILYTNIVNNLDAGSAITWNNLSYGFEHLKHGSKEKEWRGKMYWTEYPGSKMLENILQTPMKNKQTPLQKLQKLGMPRLIVEPGRSVTAPSGVTICEVMGAKEVLGHQVVTLDLGINNHSTNLIAPDIFPASVIPQRLDDVEIEVFLAGRLCFSGDMISKNKVTLNRKPKRGELVVIYHTGGYSADHFASNSCGFPLPSKVAILKDAEVELWRKKQGFQEVFGSA